MNSVRVHEGFGMRGTQALVEIWKLASFWIEVVAPGTKRVGRRGDLTSARCRLALSTRVHPNG